MLIQEAVRQDTSLSFRLHYVSTLDKRELDFLIVRDNVPIIALEVKNLDTTIANTLKTRNR